MSARRRADLRRIGRFLMALGVFALAGGVLSGGASAVEAGDWVGPLGNNGTIKIDGLAFDDHPNNEPHPGCVFQVDFYGFDLGDLFADVEFEAHPPTGDAVGLVSDHLFIGEDDNAGGGSEAGLDASATYDLTALLAGIEPHDQQGWHVKLTIEADGSQGAPVKHKVFWVTDCAGGTTTTTVGTTTTTVGTTTTTVGTTTTEQPTTTTTVPPTTTTAAPTTTTTTGGGQNPTTTVPPTTVPPTTVPPTTEPPTTVPPTTVAPTTTTAALVAPAEVTNTTTTVATAVLGKEVTRGETASAPAAQGRQLAATGSSTSGLMVLAGFALVIGGVAISFGTPPAPAARRN